MDYSNQNDSEIPLAGLGGRKKYRLKRPSKESIEPEEIFLDAQISDSALDERKLETPLKKKTFVVFFGLILFCLLLLTMRAFWLQIVRGENLGFLAERNRIRVTPDLAPRGIIYDKRGQALVANVPNFDLVIIPQDLPSDKKEYSLTINKIAEVLKISTDDLQKELESVNLNSLEPILFLSNLDLEKALILESHSKDLSAQAGLPGFEIKKSSLREYIFAPYFAHLFGYTGKIRHENINDYPDYFLTERVGLEGLELQYQSVLRGQPGKKEVEVDAKGQKIRQIADIQPKAGNNLVLNIDSRLQRKLYDTLKRALAGAKNGAVGIAMNPRNGKVLALVNLPSFDNNLFIKGITSQEMADLNKDPSQPFFNRGVLGQYPPGSTIKPLIAAGALQEKIIKPLSTIDCRGGISIPSRYQPEIIYRFPDWKTHGIVDIYSAIAQSCNVFFYIIGGGYDKIDGLGINGLTKYFRLFNLGSKTGLDLPGEASGFIPTPEWKKEHKNEQWYIGDTYHLAIGQGDILVTPLQVAVTTAAIANGGKLWQPQLVDKIIDSDKNIIEEIAPQLIKENFIARNNLTVVRNGMRQTITDGSARSMNDLRVRAAGKTGTAQTGTNTSPHAWFTGFAPYDSPEIVITILIENGGEGSSVAVPVAKEVLKWYFSK